MERSSLEFTFSNEDFFVEFNLKHIILNSLKEISMGYHPLIECN